MEAYNYSFINNILKIINGGMQMRETYDSPLSKRYASKEMSYLFSEDKKFKTWRKLWVALAETEMELGLCINQKQIDELKAFVEDINYEVAERKEKEIRHDVMSHVYAYGVQCPSAKGIIHLGATSCYVGDNAEIIIINEALELVKSKLLKVIANLREFCIRYKDIPALGYTHLQPAQLITVGKRGTLWLQDLIMDYESLQNLQSRIKLLGVKGTTGTQASFMELFNNDEEKVKELDVRVAKKMGYDNVYMVTGQTYPRKFDYMVISLLSQISQSAYKFSNDLRILQSFKEMEEPFEDKQVGSSAMAYKRNPMRSERMGSLCRFIITNSISPAFTASTQWFERTLDDSANKRIVLSESFLALDGVLNLYINITENLKVYEKVIHSRVNAELPFMATENILMEAVKRGGDRQELHERIRVLSMEAARRVKEEGLDNNLMDLIAADEHFNMSIEEIKSYLSPTNFVGRAPKQVMEFISEEVDPILNNKDVINISAEVNI